jgi:O-antigen ligase
VIAAVGAFEFARHWLLYASLDHALGVVWDLGVYLAREAGGALRAQGTTGHAIALGYSMAIALAFLFFIKQSVPRLLVWSIWLLVLTLGIIVSLSRGPWVGAGAMLLVFIWSGPSPVKSSAKLMLAAAALIPIVLATPVGERLIDLLPFVGESETETITYRQRLLEISIQVIWQNPLFGAFDFIYSPAMQELKQGQGIIDVVNSYLGVGLASGLVGLSLFSSFFVVVAVSILRALKGVRDIRDEHHVLGRVLLATLIGILVMIFTVSSISIIPVIYWAIAGLGIGYARMLANPAPRFASAQAQRQWARETTSTSTG